MHASEAAAARPGESPGMHAAEATAAVHPATAEAAPTVTSTAPEAAATTAAPESRRCESKRRRDHTSNDAITTLLIHPIRPLLQHSRPAGWSSRSNSFDDFK